jgi:hypothetical protein
MENIILKKYYVEPTNKYNIMSVCAFRIENNYRSTEIYYNGLKNLANKFNRYFPNFYLRLYYDISITKTNYKNSAINKENKEKWVPLISSMKKNPKIQVIKYKHPDFIIPNTNYHQGLFGTFVRFIPLFDFDNFDNFDNNNINILYISDIDVNDFGLIKGKQMLNNFLRSKSQIHFRTKSCYAIQPRYIKSEEHLDKKKYLPTFPYRIMVGSMISKIKFPHKFLNDFLDCMKNLKENKRLEECDYIQNFTNLKKNISSDKLLSEYMLITKTLEKSDFFYGIDEFFMTTSVLKYIEDNNIPMSMTIVTDIAHPIYNNYIRYNKLDDKTINTNTNPHILQFYKDIMGKYYDNNKSLHDNYNFMDKIIYNINDESNEKRKETYEYMFINFKKIMTNLYNMNEYEKYQFTRDEMLCVLNMDDQQMYGHDFIIYNFDASKYYDNYLKYKKKYKSIKNIE